MPLGQRPNGSFVQAPAVYILAAMASGMLVEVSLSVAALATGLPATVRRAVAIIGLAAFAAREFGWINFRVPDLGLIVPRKLVAGTPWTAASIWGAVLGAGFLTVVRFGAFWGLQLMVFAIAQPKRGAVLGLVYGAARALPALAIWRVKIANTAWRAGSARVFALGPTMARIGGLTMAFSALVFLFVTITRSFLE